MKTPVDKIQEAWLKFNDVYKNESSKIIDKIPQCYKSGGAHWVLRINNYNKSLVIQDIHPFSTKSNIPLNIANLWFDNSSDTCIHDGCSSCKGAGIKTDDSICIHAISCPCKKCSATF